MAWFGRCGDVGLCEVASGLVMQGKLRLGRQGLFRCDYVRCVKLG